MILPVIRKILKEDIQRAGETPKWINALLDPLNQFLDQVTLALRKNLTLEDNVRGKLFSATFRHGVTLNINPETSGRIVGVIPMSFGTQKLVSFGWFKTDNGELAVTFGFDSGGTTEAECSVFIFYG